MTISTRRQATNITLDPQLAAKARAAGINLSRTLEAALREKLAEAEQAAWLERNRAAIMAYNAHVDAHGVFSDDERRF